MHKEKLGDWKWYHKSSEVLREQTFINGLEDGPIIEYSDSGVVITKGEYAEGNEEGNWLFYVGNQKYEGSYKNGLKMEFGKYFTVMEFLAFEGSFLMIYPKVSICIIMRMERKRRGFLQSV